MDIFHASATRREFVKRAAGLVAMGTLGARRGDTVLRQSAYPFTLGVASGDPTATGVVLWTRLAPDPLHGGGMPLSRVAVQWELARDEGFRQVVRRLRNSGSSSQQRIGSRHLQRMIAIGSEISIIPIRMRKV